MGLSVEVGLDETAVREVLSSVGRYAKDVRADERQAAELGAGGVPFFILDKKYGVAGLQSVESRSRRWPDRAEHQNRDLPCG
ncbi:DsbA family oxidoreductase [Streptomyces sp. NBC_01320]|uniref:DsbA family oxidoreductase n=1 Tax=Streptomyces sp. NBC_01320 TaxID=2903824 RepID=UPI003FA36936